MSQAEPIALDIKSTARMLAVSVSTVERLVRLGDFPKPRKVSGRRVVYLMDEVKGWLAARPVSDLLPPPNTGAPKPRRKPAPVT